MAIFDRSKVQVKSLRAPPRSARFAGRVRNRRDGAQWRDGVNQSHAVLAEKFPQRRFARLYSAISAAVGAKFSGKVGQNGTQ